MKSIYRSQLFLLFLFIGFSLLYSCGKDDEIIVDDSYIEVNDSNIKVVNSEPQDIKAWFEYLCSPDLGGRYSGSDGIIKAMNYISDVIGKKYPVEIDHFITSKCEMNNIIYHIQGARDSLIVLGAHYDAYGYFSHLPLPGADDNMSGVAVLLAVIKYLQAEGIYPQYNIDICFFDGEEIGRYGSSRYLTQCEYGIKKYINIDTCGNKDVGAYVLYDNTHPYLKEEFEDYIRMVKDVSMKTAIYNPQGYTTDCYYFERKHIPFVSIQNYEGAGWLIHSFNDDISYISFEKIDNIAKGLVLYLHAYSEVSSGIQEVKK